MPFGLNTFLNYFGSRKVLSGSNSTHLPNAHRNPRAARRSRSARLHAAENAARVHKRRSTANATPNSKGHTYTAGTGTARATKQRGTNYRRANARPVTASKPLRRRNTVLVPQPPTHPKPPGAFVVEPSFVVPGYPELDDRNLPPCVEHKIFFDALDKGCDALLRAEEEQKEQARYQHQLRQDSKKPRSACHGCRTADEAERTRLLEEELRKAEAARRREEKEELERLLEEDKRKAWEAHRRALEQERQRQAEREAMEKMRREKEERQRQAEREAHLRAMEQERQRQAEREAMERRERERREREAALSRLVTPLRVYEDRWAALRSNAADVEDLRFHDIPWPSFDHVRGVEDLTEDRILAFVSQLHEQIQGPGGGLAKSLRSELLRWHPDKFNGQVLVKVMEGHRDAVKNGAGRVTRILNTLIARMR